MGRAGSPPLKSTMRYGTVRQYSTLLCRVAIYKASEPTRAAGASASPDESKEPKVGRKTPLVGSRLLPLKLHIFFRGVYFADARERFTGPARTFFSFSAGKRRMLLLGGREAVNEGGSEGL